jgi:hypothetical protein
MVCLIEELRNSTVARWHANTLDGALDDARAGEDSTRIRYYRAFLANLDEFVAKDGRIEERGRDHELRDAVLRSAGAQSPSTLYSLAGPSAVASMFALARADVAGQDRPRRDAVARLAAEVKVWRHWPYRIGWLAQLGEAEPHSRQLAAASLIRVLAVWAHDNQLLAGAYEGDPPLSAVEDFLVITAGCASAGQVTELLRCVVEAGRGPLGASPHDVFEAVSGELVQFGLVGRPTFGELTDRLAESLAGLRQLWPHLDGAERSRLHQEFGSDFADLAAIVGGVHAN